MVFNDSALIDVRVARERGMGVLSVSIRWITFEFLQLRRLLGEDRLVFGCFVGDLFERPGMR